MLIFWVGNRDLINGAIRCLVGEEWEGELRVIDIFKGFFYLFVLKVFFGGIDNYWIEGFCFARLFMSRLLNKGES